MKLSVIIPSYKDPLLHKIIDDILRHFELGDQYEIVVVLDGYWPKKPVIDDPHVKLVHLGKNRGMREVINAGVLASSGEFLLRADEHCMFDQGFDIKMVNACKPNWIMTATRYFLDPVKWEVMKLLPVINEKLKIRKDKGVPFKFEGQKWKSRDKKTKNEEITETMAMQGSCWMMPRKWWDDVIVELETEGYGPMYQDSHEMVFKTWKRGGKLMVNRRTWFAHKHVSFSRTHHYSRADYEPCLKFTLDKWSEYYNNEIKPKWKI